MEPDLREKIALLTSLLHSAPHVDENNVADAEDDAAEVVVATEKMNEISRELDDLSEVLESNPEVRTFLATTGGVWLPALEEMGCHEANSLDRSEPRE